MKMLSCMRACRARRYRGRCDETNRLLLAKEIENGVACVVGGRVLFRDEKLLSGGCLERLRPLEVVAEQRDRAHVSR